MLLEIDFIMRRMTDTILMKVLLFDLSLMKNPFDKQPKPDIAGTSTVYYSDSGDGSIQPRENFKQ